MAKATNTAAAASAAHEKKVEPAASDASYGVSIFIPMSVTASTRYRAGRIDTDLRHTEQLLMRRIQDALETTGKKCRGPADVLRFILAQVAVEESENQP